MYNNLIVSHVNKPRYVTILESFSLVYDIVLHDTFYGCAMVPTLVENTIFFCVLV